MGTGHEVHVLSVEWSKVSERGPGASPRHCHPGTVTPALSPWHSHPGTVIPALSPRRCCHPGAVPTGQGVPAVETLSCDRGAVRGPALTSSKAPSPSFPSQRSRGRLWPRPGFEVFGGSSSDSPRCRGTPCAGRPPNPRVPGEVAWSLLRSRAEPRAPERDHTGQGGMGGRRKDGERDRRNDGERDGGIEGRMERGMEGRMERGLEGMMERGMEG